MGKKLAVVLVILYACFWILPAYFTLQTTILPTFTSPLNLTRASLETWREIPWHRMAPMLRNSLFACGVAASLGPLVSILAGFGFARYDFPGKEKLFYLVLLAMAVPGTMLFLPRYLIVAQAGFANTLIGLLAPALINPGMIFLSRQYIASIDQDTLDAARLDGASEWGLFRHIVLPVSLPLVVLAAVGVFGYVWGDFMWQYLVGRDYQTLTVGLGLFILSVDAGHTFTGAVSGKVPGLSLESLRAACSVIQSLPLIVVFAIGQKWFVKGVRL